MRPCGVPAAQIACHAYDITLAGPGHHLGLPGPTVTLVLPVGAPLDVAWQGDDASRAQQWAALSGLHVRAAVVRHHGAMAGVQVDLSVDACRAVLGLPAAALAGTLVDATGEGPGWLRRLPEQLADVPATQWEPLVRSAIRQAIGRARRATSPAISRALALLADGVSVTGVATEVGYSRRRLSTLVRVETGHDPQTFRRIARLDRARRHLAAWARAGTGGRSLALADVAAAVGFADHAHLTRDWTALTGRSPTTWLREEFPILQASGTGAAEHWTGRCG